MKLRKAVVGLLTGALLMGTLCCTPAMAEDVTDYKIGVSIMELTAYTWYQGVIDGCKQWLEENGEAKGVNLDFDFEDSRSDVQTMLTNLDNMVAAGSDGIILFPADASSVIMVAPVSIATAINHGSAISPLAQFRSASSR